MRLFGLVLLWDVMLILLAAMVGGGGHGIMFPFVMSCAPFPAGTTLSIGWLALPLSLGFWYVVARTSLSWRPEPMPWLLGTQYLGGLIIFGLDHVHDPYELRPEEIGKLRYFAPLITAWAVLFVGGQMALWWAWLRRRRNGDYHGR
jgi:hypothetical protein